jgi:hypothetical protein
VRLDALKLSVHKFVLLGSWSIQPLAYATIELIAHLLVAPNTN